MSIWIFFLSTLAIPLAQAWIPDIVELNDAELAEINKKCTSKSEENLSEPQDHLVFEKAVAPSGRYPFMAFVGNDKEFLCGAVFISRRHLLTVRDCLWVPRRDGLKISVYTAGECYGEAACNDGILKEIGIDVAIFDAQEWGHDTRDLAIVQILSSTPNSVLSQIDFVCLPEKDAHLPSSAIVIGWGRMDVSTPPKHLQHAPIELTSANEEANFFGTITYAKEMPNFDNRLGWKFAEFGSNSSAGNAVVSYCEERKRYVLNGLLLGSSWSSNFGRTFSDGVKIASFHSDLCHRLRLCVNGVDRLTTVRKLKMVSGYSPRAEGGGAAYGFAGGYAEGHGTVDGRYCHQENTGTDHNPNATAGDIKLVHYNAPGGYVNIDGEVNASDTITFDLGNAWDKISDKWYLAADHPQLSLKVCLKDDTTHTMCKNGLIFCWRNGFGKEGQPTERDADINSKCQEGLHNEYFNAMRITYLYYAEKFNLAFLHSKGENLTTADLSPKRDGCWYFRFIKWHKDMTKYNFGIYAVENPSFLPYLELDSKSPDGLDSIKIKVIGSEGCQLYATLQSEFATPCYFKWVPMKMGGCGNEGGYNPLQCKKGRSTKMSRTVVTRDVRKGVMDAKQFEEYTNTTTEMEESVNGMVKTTVQQHTDTLEKKCTESLTSTVKASKFGFSADMSTKIAHEMSQKVTKKFSESFTESLTKKAGKEVSTKLQTVRTLQSIKTTCEEKIKEITETGKVEEWSTVTTNPGSYIERCVFQHVCHGKDEVWTNETPFDNNDRHPDRDPHFT